MNDCSCTCTKKRGQNSAYWFLRSSTTFHPMLWVKPTHEAWASLLYSWMEIESVEVSRIQNNSVTLFQYFQDARTKCAFLLSHRQSVLKIWLQIYEINPITQRKTGKNNLLIAGLQKKRSGKSCWIVTVNVCFWNNGEKVTSLWYMLKNEFICLSYTDYWLSIDYTDLSHTASHTGTHTGTHTEFYFTSRVLQAVNVPFTGSGSVIHS